jgi:uncharacterized membrane protein YgdD (TMEM256/DUF423 family)
MTSTRRLWLSLAALSGLVSVAAGAFGAHAETDPMAKELLRTGSTYEMTHALAVYAADFLVGLGAGMARFAAPFFLVGALLFSGSLYALALGAPRLVGAITPIGGVAFMVGWVLLTVGAWRSRPTP